jgi:hypothetical protein
MTGKASAFATKFAGMMLASTILQTSLFLQQTDARTSG